MLMFGAEPMVSKGLIVGASAGYSRENLELFVASSLAQTSADLWLLIDEQDHAIHRWLSVYDRIRVIPTPFKEGARASVVFRFFRILEVLRSCNYSSAVICDTRDVVFQADPFARMPGGFMAAGERLKIGESSYNLDWVNKFCGPTCFERLRLKTILCAGVMGGRVSNLIDVLQQLCDRMGGLLASPQFDGELWGMDQSLYNQVLYESIGPDQFEVSLPTDGPFFNMGDETNPRMLKKGLILNDSDTPPAILHQYDRIAGLEHFLKGVYCSRGD